MEMGVERLVGLLADASAAAAYEALGRRGDLDPAIAGQVPGAICVGPAYTVSAPPHRSGSANRALDLAPPGSVLVIDTGGDPDTCALGGTGSLAAQMRGIAGCVTNGRVRDLAEIRALRFPVFARGGTVRSSRKDGTAEFQIPVAIGGQIVRPGDLVCADDDGVVIIGQQYFDTFAERLAARLAFERDADARVRAGASYAQAVSGRP